MAGGDSPIVGVSLDRDPVIEASKKDIHRTLIRENLKLTPEQRLRKLQAFVQFIQEAPAGAATEAVSTDFAALIRALAEGRTDFILVGGVAAAVHGAARATYDVDVLYARNPHNIARTLLPRSASNAVVCRWSG